MIGPNSLETKGLFESTGFNVHLITSLSLLGGGVTSFDLSDVCPPLFCFCLFNYIDMYLRFLSRPMQNCSVTQRTVELNILHGNRLLKCVYTCAVNENNMMYKLWVFLDILTLRKTLFIFQLPTLKQRALHKFI